jgi:hypothetical protein
VTAETDLSSALAAVDWRDNIDFFVKSRSLVRRIAACNYRLAVWAKQYVSIDTLNPAVSFVHEMQQSGFHVAALAALALYRPAAAAIRTAVEAGLYYTYFRTHPAELATLARASGYFISKKELLDYHKNHSRGFIRNSRLLQQPSRFVTWYSQISSVIHGQLPGKWGQLTSLSAAKPNKEVLEELVLSFESGIDNLNDLFVLTAGRDLWAKFSPESKLFLLDKIPLAKRRALRMDSI